MNGNTREQQLEMYQLEGQFRALGYRSYTDIAKQVSQATGEPYYQIYRALLYLSSSRRYLDLMERGLEDARMRAQQKSA